MVRECFSLTCQSSGESERRHALIFRLLQPFPHATERFPTGLKFTPRLRITQEIAERSLATTEHQLCEHCLGHAVSLQFGCHARRHRTRVYLVRFRFRLLLWDAGSDDVTARCMLGDGRLSRRRRRRGRRLLSGIRQTVVIGLERRRGLMIC